MQRHRRCAPSLSPDTDVQQTLSPQARLAAAGDLPGASGGARAATAAALNVLQEGLQEIGNAPPAMASPKGLRSDDVTLHTNTPPPFRGAQPSAQPIALPSLPSDAPLATTARHLLGDTEAAIARQTLLQVASLPDRIDAPAPRIDPTAPRWHFEIPFATPQGTAMAEFEISRDGGGGEVEAAKRVWRARFSLDVEPAGPVHALISLVGDTTSVRMWAERPATVAQLRAGAAQLSQALARAELQPGDIVISDGAPPQSSACARRAFSGSRAMRVQSTEPARGRAALRQDRRAAGYRQGQGIDRRQDHRSRQGEQYPDRGKRSAGRGAGQCRDRRRNSDRTLQGGGGSAGVRAGAVAAGALSVRLRLSLFYHDVRCIVGCLQPHRMLP